MKYARRKACVFLFAKSLSLGYRTSIFIFPIECVSVFSEFRRYFEQI